MILNFTENLKRKAGSRGELVKTEKKNKMFANVKNVLTRFRSSFNRLLILKNDFIDQWGKNIGSNFVLRTNLNIALLIS